ncbi:MAG: hypothetical protein JO249_14440, partial [Acidobacteria bacterium]|nr:hypothetical protein [Acidobacteriota bacterium]
MKPIYTIAATFALITFAAQGRAATSSPATTSLFTQNDVASLQELTKSALTLERNINDAVDPGKKNFDLTMCLFELEDSVQIITDGLNAETDLVELSTNTRDAADAVTVNVTILGASQRALDSFAAVRNSSVSQLPGCS